MIEIQETAEFSRWMSKLKNVHAQAKIQIRIDRLAHGNQGQVNHVGEGVSELKIDYGQGYRVYYIQRGETLAILLCGGDKSTQAYDIKTAKKLAREVKQHG